MKKRIGIAVWPVVMLVVPIVFIANGLWPLGLAVVVAGYFILPLLFGGAANNGGNEMFGFGKNDTTSVGNEMVQATSQPYIKEATEKFSDAMHACTAAFHGSLLGTELSEAVQHGLITYFVAAHYAIVCRRLKVPRRLATNQFQALFDGIEPLL